MPGDPSDSIPAVRILPMSDRIAGFRDRTIAQVQAGFFLKRFPLTQRGKFRYPRSGLNAERGTIVLFQFQARAVASAVFWGDEKFETPRNGHAGALHFDPASIRTFEPWDAEMMRAVWPSFRRFGHAKFMLNPGNYAAFERRLKNVRRPASRQVGES